MVTRCSVMEISVLSSSVCCSACSLVFLSKCNAITGLARKYDVSHRASSHHCWRDKLCGSSTIELCLLSQTVWSLEVKIDTWSWSSHEWHWLTEYQCQKENKLEQTSQEVKKKKSNSDKLCSDRFLRSLELCKFQKNHYGQGHFKHLLTAAFIFNVTF